MFDSFTRTFQKQGANVERHGADHFHWPSLDIDLTLDMIDHPEKYPKQYRYANKPPGHVSSKAAAQAEDGAPVCRMVISNITERKEAEESK